MPEAELLHELEKKMLLALKELGNQVSQDILEERSGLSKDELNKATEWLKEKQLINVNETIREKYASSELGKRYARERLPEHRFLIALKEKEKTIPELRQKANLSSEEFNVAIGLLKKAEAISVAAGKISITPEGKKIISEESAEEKMLKLLDSAKYFDEIPMQLRPYVAALKGRGLVDRSDEKIKEIILADKAKKLIPNIKFEKTIDVLTPELILSGKWQGQKFKKYNLNAATQQSFPGKKQPYLKFVDDLKQKMIGLGFEEMSGPYVELSLFNNDVLFMPQDHPAREIHDAFSLKEPKKGDTEKYQKLINEIAAMHETGGKSGSRGWGYKFDPTKTAQLLLRSQTTAVSARTMISKELKIPGKYFTVDRNFRVDVIDWKHLAEFDQLEGIVLEEGITFRELLGLLKLFAEEIGGCKKVKFVPGYFPFTEPSVELSVWMEGKGWIEIGGAGIFRPEVTQPLGIKVPVIAWGLGILRLFMTKYEINDMRQVFSTDLKWIRDFKW